MIWWTKIWNPIIGCTPCSPACDNCYAQRLHTQRHQAKLAGAPMPLCYAEPFDKVRCLDSRLFEPLHWHKPQRVFVGNMGDLFHEDVPFGFLDHIFHVMERCPQHIFMLLTKRPEWMAEYLKEWHPLSRVWLGTTIWDQASADRAVPLLLNTPAAKHFVSVEPMLGPVVLRQPSVDGGITSALTPNSAVLPKLDWVICGGETGPGARPMHPDWPRKLRDDCQAAGVPFFFKQWGEWAQRGGVGIVEAHGSGVPNFAWPDGTVRWGKSGDCGGEGVMLARVGARRAGRELDGRTWEEVPA